MTTRLLTAFAFLLCVSFGLDASQADWQARWISCANCPGDANSWIAFQKKVDLEAVPAELPARIAADSKYWLWINGRMVVNEGGLKRGPAPGDGYYDTVDIAPFLQTGENVISVLLWYFGRVGRSHMGSGIPAMIFEAVGGGVRVLSDPSWSAVQHTAYSTAPGQKPNFCLSESNVRYDARDFEADWFKSMPKRRESATELPFAPGQPPLGRLVPRPIPLWKDYGLRDYEQVRRCGDTLVCTLPYNAQFSPYMELDAPEGRIIGLHTDHDSVSGLKCVHGEYVTRAGSQTYEHLPWMNGQYMYYIVPPGVEVKKVQFRETGYDCAFSGYFRCDDPVLEEYWQKAQRTLYVCMRDTWMDCPDRERAQWWGDEVHELTEAFYALSPSSWNLARKGILELVAWAASDGSLFAPVPSSNRFRELPQQMLAAVGWYGFHNYCFYSGDDSVVGTVYPAMHRYLHEIWNVDADGLPVERTEGWNWADAGRDIDKKALLHCWYYLALKGERAFALKCGLEDDAVADERMMTRLKDSYNRICWNGSFYRTPGYSGPADDRVQALAVVSGIAGPDKYDAILRVLNERNEAESYIMRFVIEALFAMGQPEAALARMRGFALEVMSEDSSTLREHRSRRGKGSSNHAWSGHGIILMGQKVAGIEPLEPGFRSFSVKPRMGYLRRVECGLETSFGMIEVKLQRNGRRIRAIISVPEGATAVVTDSRNRELRLGPGSHSITMLS